MARIRARWLVAAVLLAAGCGTVENPDLSTGAVTGRISGASAGAFAYVLGAPAVHAPIATDGTFRLDGVPAGNRTIVLFDGVAGAGTVSTEVEGASISVLPPADTLPPACSVLASAMLAGAQPTGLAFSVDGTLLRAADGSPATSVPGPAAVLYPLPAGWWTLRAGQPGFVEQSIGLYVDKGRTWPVDVSLDVESTSSSPGCVSSGCESSSYSLKCDASDGRCYECASSADCSGGATCDPGEHVCVAAAPPPGSLSMCQACTAAADCAAGPGGEVPACFVAAGASVGYCSYDCGSPTGHPSGYLCDNVPAGLSGNPAKAWRAPVSCLALQTTYGAACATDSACSGALDGGKCLRPAGVSDGTPGVCSAPCTASADCPAWLAGWTCDLSASYCRPP